MSECTYNLSLHLVAARISIVANIFPYLVMHTDLRSVVAEYINRLFGEGCDNTKLAIVVEFFGRGVVLNEHHTGTHLERELLIDRIHGLWESVGNSRVVGVFFAFQCIHLALVNRIHFAIVGR